MYWGGELLKCREILTQIIFNQDLPTGEGTSYFYTLKQLKLLKSEFGEDISEPLVSLETFLEKDIESRAKLRRVFGESLFQMTFLALIINFMNFAFNYYLNTKTSFLEYFILNCFMAFGGWIFRLIFESSLTQKVSIFINAQASLNQFLILTGTSVSSNEIINRMNYKEFERDWVKFSEQRKLLMRALNKWNDMGEDPRAAIHHVSKQLSFKFDSTLDSFKKVNEGVKLLFLIVFFLLPYFYTLFSRLFNGLLVNI